jgi:ABC-type sugar transport system ATPase subunit
VSAPHGAEDGKGVNTTQTLLVRVSELRKSFGPTRALTDCTFELRPGEVHAIVGENGSGKSTLVKILSGVHSPDAGTIEVAGTAIPGLRAPRSAQEAGIATVFQEVLVAEARNALDNIWLGVDGLLRTRVSTREKRARALEIVEQLVGRSLDLDIPVELLSLSDRQACCIARALVRRPRILILDEATSALDVATRERLFRIVRRLSDDGAGVVFITHRMDEIAEIGDRITVMRSGRTVATLARGAWKPSELVRLMTGSDRVTQRAREAVDSADTRLGDPVISTNALQLRREGEPVDVVIRAGELVGVAGLEGHGQNEFLDALRGVGAPGGAVMRHEAGRAIEIKTATDAADHGIAFVPRERRDALFGWMSIRENFAMPTLARDRRAGWLQPAATKRRFAQFAETLRIALRRPDDRITTLSGGNQQKVMVARWLAAEPRILVLNDPTRGIDIGTKHDLYSLIVRLADDGLAIVMLSTELDEHVELMDRVLVFREHRLSREIPRESLSRDSLVSAFFGDTSEIDADRDSEWHSDLLTRDR